MKTVVLFAAAVLSSMAAAPLRLHPENPHYFLFRERPTVLVTSGEHYGAVINLDFDYKVYLAELQRHGLNHTRTFAGAYREVLKAHGCSIISEHRSAEKERIEFVFRLPRRSTRERLDAELCAIAAELRGDVDWEVG